MKTIAGYQILKQIADTRNSQVYRAIRQSDQEIVVIKVLKEGLLNSDAAVRYQREYDMLHHCQCDGIIRSYSLERQQEILVLCLEDFDGKSIKNLLFNNYFSIEKEDFWPNFFQIAISFCEVLSYLHSLNIIHKKLNSSHILFNQNTGQLKLIGFEIATISSRENYELRPINISVEGDLSYISPEQSGRMNSYLDYRTDFYSFGVILYEFLSKRLPFVTDDPLQIIHLLLAKQPSPLHQLSPRIPEAISRIVSKLLAKNPEDRYTTAWGIKADLLYCQQNWLEIEQLAKFPLGQQDFPDRPKIPQSLYGRAQEIEVLFNAVEKTAQGSKEIILISAASGLGKTALVRELYQPIYANKGYLISGKFERYKSDIPYSGIKQLFQSLLKQILTESEECLTKWRKKLVAALGKNSQVLVEIIPEIELILGKQPSVSRAEPFEEKNRLTLSIKNFIRVFLQSEYLLVIFLDNLQWADSASI